MKMQFSILMNGEESFKEKIEQSLRENPTLHMDLIKSFSHAVMMAFRLNDEDNISIESFKASKVEDSTEKKVDS